MNTPAIVLAILGMTACAAPVAASARTAPARAVKPAKPLRPLASDFDLSQVGAISREDAAPADPVPPRGADLRAVAWDPPVVELEMGRGGPVLGVGALGSRRKGVPKLAHVSVAWSF